MREGRKNLITLSSSKPLVYPVKDFEPFYFRQLGYFPIYFRSLGTFVTATIYSRTKEVRSFTKFKIVLLDAISPFFRQNVLLIISHLIEV